MLILTGGDGMADWLLNCGPCPTIPGTEEEEGQEEEYDVPVEVADSGRRPNLYLWLSLYNKYFQLL